MGGPDRCFRNISQGELSSSGVATLVLSAVDLPQPSRIKVDRCFVGAALLELEYGKDLLNESFEVNLRAFITLTNTNGYERCPIPITRRQESYMCVATDAFTFGDAAGNRNRASRGLRRARRVMGMA